MNRATREFVFYTILFLVNAMGLANSIFEFTENNFDTIIILTFSFTLIAVPSCALVIYKNINKEDKK